MKNLLDIGQGSLLRHILKWCFVAICVGVLAGSASALFIISLTWVTDFRRAHSWILYFLPIVGGGIGWIYHKWGQTVEPGNNLIIDEIHDPKAITPLRMTPLILVGTLATHLFGGSAGREGTAVQMGGSLADQLTHLFRLDHHDRRILLMSGISAGFASVFGAPLAGAVFGLEVLAIGRLRYDAILPCFVAAIAGDQVTRAWGVQHTFYWIPAVPNIHVLTLVQCAFAGMIFGLVGMLFAKTVHLLTTYFKTLISFPPFRPVIGGAIIIVSFWMVQTDRYLGLGIPTMVDAFNDQVHPFDFLGKFYFTVVTLASGFKGGEVTPLFFIGATLGNTLSSFLSLSAPFLAGLGLVAVFAGAANTPISSTLLAIELFGAPIGVFAAITCVMSYLFSGHAGIYHAQKIEEKKNREI